MSDIPTETVPKLSTRGHLSTLFQIREHKRSIISRLCLVLIGMLLVGIGIVGWVLPFVPGIPILIVGLSMIMMSIPGSLEVLNRYHERLPKFFLKLLRRQKQSSFTETRVASFFEPKDV